MINYTRLSSCLSNLVGYRTSDSSCDTALDPSAQTSDSTQYVTSLPGITPQMIEDAMPRQYADINRYLESVITEETVNAVKDFIKRHKEFTMARHLIDNLDVVQHLQYIQDLVTKSGRFVGIELQPAPSDNIATWVRMIGVQFTALNPTLVIYLFNSSLVEPLATFTLTGHNRLSSLQWFDMQAEDFVANYKSIDAGTGSKYYIGYFEDDLAGQACDTRLYGACCGNEVWVSRYMQHCMVRGVTFAPSALNGTDLPDLKKVGYTEETFGLHLKLSVTCDITETICQNRMMFDSIVQKKQGMRIYSDFLNTNRVNPNASMSRDLAIYNLEKLQESYNDDLKSIQFDLSGIDRFCLPCAKGGITVSTMT